MVHHKDNLKRFAGHGLMIVPCVLILGSTPALEAGFAGFEYEYISEPIVSATFSADFAALVAHRTVAGYELNYARLVDTTGELPDLDLSDELFGTAEWPDEPKVNQGQVETGWISADIDSSFFDVLHSGRVGLRALFTDSDDAMFAVDCLILTIETAAQTVEAYYGWPIEEENNGFGIDVPDGGDLYAPLPESIPFGATGTGFDETISVKAIPEPASAAIGIAALSILLRRGMRRGSAPA